MAEFFTTLRPGLCFLLERQPGRAVLRLTRTIAPIPSIESFFAEAAAVEAVVATLGQRTRHRLLVDLREGPLRTDPAFEEATRREGMRLFAGYARTAILVKTAVGKLQLQRMVRGSTELSQTEVQVFDDESAALAWIQAPSRRSSPG